MSKYQFPTLDNYSILYRGRRFIAFSISKSAPFEGMEDYANFVVWDGLHDAAVSYGKISKNGLVNGFLAFSHVEIEVKTSDSIKEFVKNTSKEQNSYFRKTVG